MDEAALLREALAFIGDLDGDDGSLSPPSIHGDAGENDGGFLWSLFAEPLASDTAHTSPHQATAVTLETTASPPLSLPTTVAPSSATTRTANRSRTKRREELVYLRETVGDLEAKLTQIKRKTKELQLENKGVAGEKADSSALVHASWEHVATRQNEQRGRAETENIKLKRLLEDQILLGKSLDRLLQRKRPQLKSPLYARGEKRARLDSLPTSWDHTQIFQELLASSESQYCETLRVLTKVLPLVRDMVNNRKIELVHDDELGMVLRATEARVLPFEYELVVQEFWQSIPAIPNARVSDYQNVASSGDLIQAKFHAKANFGRVSGNLNVYIVDRRFHERQRNVFVTSAYIDPTEISDMNMDGVYMYHKGWVVIEQMVTESGRAATRMTSYSVTVPHVLDGLGDQTRKVGALTNFIMSSMSIDLESRQQAFEDRLFDQRCHSPSKQ